MRISFDGIQNTVSAVHHSSGWSSVAAALTAGDLIDILQSLLADKEALRKVLLYHVVAGKVEAKDVVTLNSATTAQGSDVMIDTSNGVKVNDANVVKTDIMTSNGIIHVIDTVLMPK